jgi:hypothetical protein
MSLFYIIEAKGNELINLSVGVTFFQLATLNKVCVAKGNIHVILAA